MDNNRTEFETAAVRVPLCSVCGASLVHLERKLASIHTRREYKEPDSLSYQTAMICPKRTGLMVLLYFRHDYRLFADDGSEIRLDEDEFTMAI